MRNLTRTLLLCTAAMLVCGVWLGLARIGLEVPLGPLAPLLPYHGALMVSVVFASLITLERAVALKSRVLFASTAMGLVAFALFLAEQTLAARILIFVASLAPFLALFKIWRKSKQSYALFLAGAALCLCVANAVWIFKNPGETARLIPFWMSYFVLTILGERLELGRVIFGQKIPAKKLLYLSFATLLTGAVFGWGKIVGIAFIGMSFWLLKFDIARKTILKPALPRFIAINILLGGLWVGISGLGHLALPQIQGEFFFDASVHALFLGFVMTMIFAHAPIILPALTGLAIEWTRWLYVPTLLLQMSLVLRVGCDLGENADLRVYAGLGHLIALLSYPVVVLLKRWRIIG